MNLKGRDFLKLLDYTSEEIEYLINLAEDLKKKKKNGIPHDTLKGKNIALIFEKTSTRTRCSFEVAARDLGMGVTYLDPNASQIGRKESIADTARVLCSMYDGIEYRGYGQEVVEELAKYSSVPVWNGLTNEFHPTQILADFLTIKEQFGTLKGLNFTACAPQKYFPDSTLVDECKKIAKESGSKLCFEEDPIKATKNADIIYTDIWVSMGEPELVWAERINDLESYQVNSRLMKNAKDTTIFMHCLPSYHDKKTEIGKRICEKFNMTAMEVTDEVFESEQSVVFREAENRMHTIKAVMYATL